MYVNRVIVFLATTSTTTSNITSISITPVMAPLATNANGPSPNVLQQVTRNLGSGQETSNAFNADSKYLQIVDCNIYTW